MFENAHTRVLGALLEFDNNRFLWPFLERCNININKNHAKKQKTVVKIERQYKKNKNNVWQTDNLNDKEETKSLCRPDCIVWKRNAFAIIIENKINGASETKNQVDNYIDAINSDKNIWNSPGNNLKKIWVIYLGGDSEDMPSDESLTNQNKSLFLKKNKEAGTHLSLISYKNHILPWLEEDVLPNCPFGMTGLTGGLLVYIDYLKSLFEDTRSKDNLFYESSEVITFIENNGGCSYDQYKAISSSIGSEKEDSDDGSDLFKAIRHYYLNNHFKFLDQTLKDTWAIRNAGSSVHIWKKSWECIQDKPRPTCDLFFELFPYQIDDYLNNPTTFRKAITCRLKYKGKDNKLRKRLNKCLNDNNFPGLDYYVFNKNSKNQGNTLDLNPDGAFFESFVKDETIANICSIIDGVLSKNLSV